MAGCVLVYVCIGSLERVSGVLLIAFKERFPNASTTQLTAVTGVSLAMSLVMGPFTTAAMNKGASARSILVSEEKSYSAELAEVELRVSLS